MQLILHSYPPAQLDPIVCPLSLYSPMIESKKNIHDLKTIKLNGCLIGGLYNLLELIFRMTLICKETFIYPTPQQ